MADYKYTQAPHPNHDGVQRYSDMAFIPKDPGNRDWQEYLTYDAGGGVTDPWKTDEELKEEALASKLVELTTEYQSRVDTANGTSDSRTMNKKLSRQARLIRKEANGNATPDDIIELDNFDTLDDHLDNLDSDHDVSEAWLEDPVRTIEEIEIYDVIVDPNWSIM